MLQYEVHPREASLSSPILPSFSHPGQRQCCRSACPFATIERCLVRKFPLPSWGAAEQSTFAGEWRCFFSFSLISYHSLCDTGIPIPGSFHSSLIFLTASPPSSPRFCPLLSSPFVSSLSPLFTSELCDWRCRGKERERKAQMVWCSPPPLDAGRGDSFSRSKRRGRSLHVFYPPLR